MSLYQYLKSLKLAVALLVYLTITGTLASFIPQGLDPVYYTSHYPKIVATLIMETQFYRFFTSILFLGPSILFFINLTLCTVDRFRKELKKKRGPKRFGPDILHFGLILLTIGAIVTFSSRKEGYVELAIGDKVELPDGKLLKLVDFRYLTYPDGRPQDWISTVQVSEGQKTIIEKAEIRVNHPLTVGRLKLYQVSHKVTMEILLEDSAGKTIHLTQGDRISRGTTSLFFMAMEEKSAFTRPRVVLHTSGPAGTRVIRAEKGDQVLDLSVKDIRPMDITGLEAVTDPGTEIVFVAFLIVLVGLTVTFAQRVKTLSK
ncbi:MAG: cytochrome c biogenesis protein ResB [Spirochaetes bacterium]|nr:cytochrome c biogenesis protein ResB [Spirochaetota bacterium]